MLKKFLIAIVAVVVIVVVAVIAIVTLVDVDRFKPQIQQAVADRYGRTLAIDGRLSLSVIPRIALALPAATLSEPRSSTEAARLSGAKVSVALLPLLRGEVVADGVAIDGLAARIERRADGSLNIDDLLGRSAPQPTPAPAPAQAPAGGATVLPKIDIGGIKLSNAKLVFDDRKAGVKAGIVTTVERLNLETGRIANQVTTPVSLALAFDRTEPKAAGELTLKGEAVLDLAGGRYGARKLEAGGRATVGTTVIEKARVTVDAIDVDPAKATVALSQLVLAVAGKLAADSFEAQISAPKLAIAETSASGETLAAVVKLGGASAVDARIEASGIAGSTTALSIARIAITATSTRGERKITAQLATPLTANVAAGNGRLAGIVGQIVIDDPQIPSRTARIDLAGNAAADSAKENLRADLTAKAEGTSLAAKLAVDGFTTPRVGFDITADQLDIDRFVPPKKAGSEKPDARAPGPGAAGAGEPIDLGVLKTLNLDGRIAVAKLRARGLAASNLDVAVKAADGKLDAAPITAALYGGRMAAKATVRAGATPAANQASVGADLTGVQIGPLLADVADKDLLEGRGNVKIGLQTVGATVDTMKRALDGNVVVALRDGAIKGINLAETIRNARALLQGGSSSETRGSDQTKKTDFTEFDMSATITDGVARSTDLDVKSPLLRIGGEGSADLVASRLDYTVRASVVGTSGGQGGKDLENLRGVTIPVRLTGPLDGPSWQIDWASAGREALKSRAAAELKERLKTDE
ncbi:MAG: AsmA family protein, partial [Burkholderiaceae bacterium]